MTVRIVCSGCKAAYQLADNLLGKKVRCRHCQQLTVVHPEAAPPAAADAPPAPPPSELLTEKHPDKRSAVVAPPPQESPPSDHPNPAAASAKAPAQQEEAPADDDESPRPKRRRKEAKASSRSRPKKGGALFTLAVVLGVPLICIVVLGAGTAAAYYIYSAYTALDTGGQPRMVAPGPAAFQGPDFEGGIQQPLIERQANLEAFFRTPEEPPVTALEFTEPPPVEPVLPAAGRPAPNSAGQLTREVLQKIKEATVYLRVKSQRGESEGSGFFCIEPGAILTNAHVVGMLERSAPPPQSVRVVRNKGEKNETSFPAQVVAVDQDADLALLSVAKEGMPAPLVVKSARDLQETQSVYVAGFPLGEVPGKSITIDKYELSSLKKEKGVLDKLQVHGDMLPGNSGGPLLDAEGDVVGVCVAILRNTRINFAIPGDKVWRFLNGRLTELNLDMPTQADGKLRVPVSVRLVDPLGRMRQANVEYWIGNPGPARPGSRTAPQPQAGDSERQTLTLELPQQAGRGELTLPPLPAGQAYWLQPSLVNAAGEQVWLSAQVYRAPAPVERKPARLVLKPAAEWPMVLERWSALEFADLRAQEHRVLLNLEARWTDHDRGPRGNDLALHREFTGFKEGVAINGKAHMTRRLQQLGPNIRTLAHTLGVNTQGTINRDDIDQRVMQADLVVRRELVEFQQPMQRFLQGLAVTFPMGEVQVGQTWKNRVPLPIDPTWKVINVLPPQIWGNVEGDLAEVTYTYLGMRTVNGAEQAVINLKGQQTQAGGGTVGRVSGTVVVDLATGQVIEEEVTTQANIEMVILPPIAVKAQGTVVARLRRE